MSKKVFGKSSIITNNKNCVKQLQVLFYVYDLVQKLKMFRSEFATRNVKYLRYHSFENCVHGNQDHNAIIIIPLKLALRLSLSSGCWVLAKFFSRDSNCKQTHPRWVKTIIDYNIKDENCYISLILYHNLQEKLVTKSICVEMKNEKMINSVYLVTRLFLIWNSKINLENIFSTYMLSLQPKYAYELSLSIIDEPLKYYLKDEKDVETILQYHFTSPKYLHVGDVIPIFIPIPQSILNDSVDYIFWPKFLYFCVTAINESQDRSSSAPGYLVSKDRSTLYLSGTEKVKIPYLNNAVCTEEEMVPPCLNNIFNKICIIFYSNQPLPVFNQLKCTNERPKKEMEKDGKQRMEALEKVPCRQTSLCFGFFGSILLIGPTGSGKIKVIKLLAEKYSYCIKWIDCLSLKGDTSAATEGKISQAFANIRPYSIVVLIRIGSLSKDKDGNNDPRVFIALKEQFNRLSRSQLQAFIIATLDDQNNISDDLWSLFTYPLMITCPTQQEREETLIWLLRAYLNLDENECHSIFKSSASLLNVLSHRTAGFLIGDLEEYVLRVHRHFVDRITEQTDENCEKMPTQEDFLNVLNEMQEQRSEALGLPRIPKVNWKDVGGLEKAKKELINTIELPIKYPNVISKSLRRSGILLYGPPGTGKTLLAKSVASECGLNFLSVKGPELIDMYIGQSEENVRDAFAKAKEAAPCVLFFDEVDSLAPNRGRSGDSGGVMDRIVSALLAELDGVATSSDVFVLAATNRPDLLDPALLRPGRFEKHIFLGMSETREDQVKLLKAITAKIPLAKDVSLERVAERLPFTLTGADFAALATDAFYIAARRVIEKIKQEERSAFSAEREKGDGICRGGGSVEVVEDDLIEASQKLKPSVSEEELKTYIRIREKRGEFSAS